jgi:uncharacterized membrane protein YeaQ/YmgE (transglycosylase-associated protein family)
MDLFSIIVMLCVGNTVGWLAGIYVEGGRLGILGDVSAATAGALATGFVYRQFVPQAGTIGLLAAGIVAATLALVLWRRFAPAAR